MQPREVGQTAIQEWREGYSSQYEALAWSVLGPLLRLPGYIREGNETLKSEYTMRSMNVGGGTGDAQLTE